MASRSPIISVFIPNSFLELSQFRDRDARSEGDTIKYLKPDRDHQLLHPFALGPADELESDSFLVTTCSESPTSFLSVDSMSSVSLSSARYPSPPGLYVYDDLVKQHEELKTERRPKSQKSVSSVSSVDSRLSAHSNTSTYSSAKSQRRFGSISVSSLSGLKRKTSARVPDIPSPLPPPSPAVSMSPSFEEDTDTETARRLRQLHKVSRTLGENIPAELLFGPNHAVFPKDEPPVPRQRSSKMMRRASLSLSSLSPFKPATQPQSTANSQASNLIPPMPTYSYPKPPKIDPSTFQQIDSVSSVAFADEDATSSSPTLLHPAPELVAEQREAIIVPQMSRSKSLRSLRRRSVSEDNFPRSQTPFADAAVSAEPADVTSYAVEGRNVLRRERLQGWSGEWNRNDMQDVISKLRNLK